MLIRFSVRNYLSFAAKENGNTEEFSMIAGRVRNKKDHIYDNGKIKLLRFAAVYGANAAGKSNLVKAMSFMQQIVISGLPDGHTEKYCKIDPDNAEKPSYFELEILLNGKYYSYGFEVILSKSKFISEWLVELHSDNTESILFARDIEKGKYDLKGFDKSASKNKLKVYAEDISEDSSVLFLSIMNQNKRNFYKTDDYATILKDVFLWIQNKLDINFPNQPISNYSYLLKADKVNGINEICRIISAFGTGITNLQMIEVPFERVLRNLPKELQNKIKSDIEQKQVEIRENKKIKSMNLMMRTIFDFFVITIDATTNIICRTIEFSHGKKDVLFGLNEESDGTIRILDLLEILIAGENKTYVIDELDRCLHPSLTYKFVETFLQVAKKKNIQLIVTTHESRLMDFDLLRRDEIWFVEKRKSGESDIYSLEEYNARFDQKIDKAYLEGRYGGVPIFSTVFPIGEE